MKIWNPHLLLSVLYLTFDKWILRKEWENSETGLLSMASSSSLLNPTIEQKFLKSIYVLPIITYDVNIARTIYIHENSMNYLSALDPYQWPGNKWYKYGNQTQYLEDFVHAGFCMFTLASFLSEWIKYKIAIHNHKRRRSKTDVLALIGSTSNLNYHIRVKPQFVLCIAYWLVKR